MDILNDGAGATKYGREQILDIIKAYGTFDSWSFSTLCNTIEAIYEKYDPTLVLPGFRAESYGSDWTYTSEHGYLLLRIDTANVFDAVRVIGLSSFFEAYKESAEEYNTETAYYFIMSCIQDLRGAAEKMLSLPIFNTNELIFSSLMYYYYLDYKIYSSSTLKHVTGVWCDYIQDDFKHMVFETNGSDPLSIRGNLPILSHYARKKSGGYYSWTGSAPSAFAKDMKSDKALNLREAFAEMESRLGSDSEGNYEEESEEKIGFTCTVGVCTEEPHYDRQKRFHGVCNYPIIFLEDNLKLGIFGTCMEPRRTDYSEQYIGWIDFTSSVNVGKIYEGIFSCLEDNIVNTLEDNYNFLLEKLPKLDKDRLRNDMLGYIIEGRQAFFLFYRTLKRSFFIL